MYHLAEATVISIVDDDASFRRATERLVRSLGHAVAAFASAEEFLKSGCLRDTTCLISDVQMPGMSGLELQNRLLALGVRLPVIFITAYPEKLLTGERPEPTYLITKPFREATVRAAISQALFFGTSRALA